MRLWGNSWGDDGLVGLGRWGAGLVLKTLRVCYENHTAPFCPPSCQWLWTHVCSLTQPLSPALHPQDGKCLQHCEMQNLSLFFWLFPPPARFSSSQSVIIFFISLFASIFFFTLFSFSSISLPPVFPPSFYQVHTSWKTLQSNGNIWVWNRGLPVGLFVGFIAVIK